MEAAHGANKAFRESLRTLIDAISSDASKLHTFLATVSCSIMIRALDESSQNVIGLNGNLGLG